MVNRQKIFIPFLDGLLTYNCHRCGYRCCLWGCIIINVRESRKLLKTYPFLRYSFAKKTNKLYNINNYKKCWFLEKSGLCHIQKKYGYSYKPFSCRSHPFCVYRCKDEYIVMEDMMGKCHELRVGRGNENISCKRILKNAQEAIDCNFLLGEIDWPMRRLDLEKKILGGSKEFLNNSNYLVFSAYQILITTKNDDIEKIKSKLLESINLWKSFLEVDKLNIENKRLTYELTAITSLLRLGSIRLRNMEARRVPLALLALYFYMLLFSKNRRMQTYVLTYEQMLNDIPLGLVYLKNEDLQIKKMPLENKIIYLRKLQVLHNEDKIPPHP